MATSTTTDLRQTVSPTVVTTTTNQATQAMIIDNNNNDDYEYDFYDQTVDAALTRLREADAMSEEETEDEREEEEEDDNQYTDLAIQTVGRLITTKMR